MAPLLQWVPCYLPANSTTRNHLPQYWVADKCRASTHTTTATGVHIFSPNGVDGAQPSVAGDSGDLLNSPDPKAGCHPGNLAVALARSSTAIALATSNQCWNKTASSGAGAPATFETVPVLRTRHLLCAWPVTPPAVGWFCFVCQAGCCAARRRSRTKARLPPRPRVRCCWSTLARSRPRAARPRPRPRPRLGAGHSLAGYCAAGLGACPPSGLPPLPCHPGC